MKKMVIIVSIVGLFVSCTMNPSKEHRIRKLESEMEMTHNKVKDLETRLENIQVKNLELEKSIKEMQLKYSKG